MTSTELLTREHSGLRVELRVTEALELELRVSCGDELVTGPVPASRGMDAFRHPFCYVSPPTALLAPHARPREEVPA